MEQDVVEDLGLPSSATIYSLSLDCQKCFGRICDELQSLEQDEANQNGYNRNFILLSFQDSRAKFKAWGTSIAALRKPSLPTSLEHRLRDAPEIRSRLLQVLTYLHEYLNDVIQIILGEKPNQTWKNGMISDSDSEDEPDDKIGGVLLNEAEETSEIQELCTAISRSNASLMKLSMLIRESSNRDDYLKAASRYSALDPSPYIGHVREKYGSAKCSNDWLVERLGKAIARRRQFLTYREEHHGKLTGDWGELLDEVAEEKGPGKTKPAKTIASTQATTFIMDGKRTKDGSDFGGSFGSQTSYEATEYDTERLPTKLTVPAPPKWAFPDVVFKYGEPFQCHFCFTEQEVKNKAEWKKHVFRDLKPYVCTFPPCAMRMFRSRNEWFAHEMQYHRREWVCQHCQHPAFASVSEFSNHLETAHSAILAKSQLEALLLQSQEPVDKIAASACPLCDEWELSLNNSRHDAKRLFLHDGNFVEPYGTPKQFRRHLGRHMEQLALFALPIKERDGLEDDSPDEVDDDDSEHSDPPAFLVDPEEDGGVKGSVGGGDHSSSSVFPKKGKTRIPGRLVDKRAIMDLGYPFEEEGKTVVIMKALSRENINEVITLSEDYKATNPVPRNELNNTLDENTQAETHPNSHLQPSLDLQSKSPDDPDEDASEHRNLPKVLIDSELPTSDNELSAEILEVLKKLQADMPDLTGSGNLEPPLSKNLTFSEASLPENMGSSAEKSYGTSTAFSSSANPDEDWTKISDDIERRRIQNRIAQRNYRKKLKERLAVLEARAGVSADTPPQDLADIEPTGLDEISQPHATSQALENPDDNLPSGFQSNEGKEGPVNERSRVPSAANEDERISEDEHRSQHHQDRQSPPAENLREMLNMWDQQSIPMTGRPAGQMADNNQGRSDQLNGPPININKGEWGERVQSITRGYTNKRRLKVLDESKQREEAVAREAKDTSEGPYPQRRDINELLTQGFFSTSRNKSFSKPAAPPNEAVSPTPITPATLITPSPIYPGSFQKEQSKKPTEKQEDETPRSETESKAAQEASSANLKGKQPDTSPTPAPESDISSRKKPIKFKDAVGRKFSFPFTLCSTWAGMEELIKQAFLQVEVLGPHVQEGRYDLIGPEGEIILPQVWEQYVEPDMSITMHMWPMPEPASDAGQSVRRTGASPPPPGTGTPTPGRRPKKDEHTLPMMSFLGGGSQAKSKTWSKKI